jgi:hypothetical protein
MTRTRAPARARVRRRKTMRKIGRIPPAPCPSAAPCDLWCRTRLCSRGRQNLRVSCLLRDRRRHFFVSKEVRARPPSSSSAVPAVKTLPAAATAASARLMRHIGAVPQATLKARAALEAEQREKRASTSTLKTAVASVHRALCVQRAKTSAGRRAPTADGSSAFGRCHPGGRL